MTGMGGAVVEDVEAVRSERREPRTKQGRHIGTRGGDRGPLRAHAVSSVVAWRASQIPCRMANRTKSPMPPQTLYITQVCSEKWHATYQCVTPMKTKKATQAHVRRVQITGGSVTPFIR